MQANSDLTLNDFVLAFNNVIGGRAYSAGDFLILVGRSTYAVVYKGQTIGWGYESILQAVDAVNARRAK